MNNFLTRRQWLKAAGTGLGMIGMANVMAQDKKSNPFKPKTAQFKPKAKYLIHIMFNGGLSHVDSVFWQ